MPETPTHRLMAVPLLAMSEVIEVGAVCVGPFADLAPTMYPRPAVRRIAQSMINYHRQYNGAAIPNPSAISGADRGPLATGATEALTRQIDRSIEGFRYVALLANPTGHGPNSTHLQVERYGFREGRGRYLTIRSRFIQVLGVRRHRQRAWAHAGPAWLPRGAIDAELLAQLSGAVTRDSKPARRLWRALWWFNQAHHDDPYQPLEFSVLCLATAMEALVRPTNKVKDLQAAIRRALGTREFDDWVADFYGARSAITHGDEAWQPLFGDHAHVDHYRVATRLFPILVEHRLVELRLRPTPHPLLVSLARGNLARLLSSDEDVIARLLPHTFRSLKLRRNTKARLEVQFLSVRLNHEDLSTPSARYAELVEWLRRIAVSACRSAAARWPLDRAEFLALRRGFESGIPSIGGAQVIPPNVDTAIFFEELASHPDRRPVLGSTSLADLARAMEAAEGRRELTALRESQ